MSLLKVQQPHERALIQILLTAIDFDRSGNLDPDHPQSMPKLVESLAYRYSGTRSRSIRQVAGLLAEGVSMVDALEQTPRALDPSAVMAIRLASETGTIRETLESLADLGCDDGSLSSTVPQRFSHGVDGKLFQIAIGFIATWWIVIFLTIFIIPTIEVMFREFAIELPQTMLWLIEISRYGALLFWFCLFFFFVLFFVERRLKGRALWKRGTQESISGQTSHLLALFALVIRQGRPLASGIATLANYHPMPPIRSRLASASMAIERGTDTWQALHEQSFLTRAEANGLAMAELTSSGSSASGSDASSLPDHARQSQSWLLTYLAIHRRDRLRQRSGAWLQSISFILLMVLAAIVLFTSIAMFSAVYRLVSALAEIV